MNARRRFALGVLVVLIAALCLAPVAALAAEDAVPGELIVKYRAGVSAERRAAVEAGLRSVTHVRTLGLIHAEHLRISGIPDEEALRRLRASTDVEYAEPNHYVYAQVVPNDPSFSLLWNLLNTGQGGGYAGCDIKASQAWDLFTGDPTLKIGVIDTGIDYTHTDLAADIWTNPGEIPGNGKDDDGNGYVDDVHGYDFVNHDGDPMDDGTHGTHVAGIIGAVGNNAVGIAGVAWQCRMVAIKFMNASGVGTEADAISAIGYSVTVGCRLTNNSWGNMSGGQAMLDAINAAGAAGQLMIFAAGNNGWNIDAVPFYPPSYVAPNMITVTSTDGRDLRPTLSNYGAVTVQLGAPGVNVYSCKPGNLYQYLTGTSMAAPHVTGTAALAMGRLPYATMAQIRQLILANTDPIPSMAGITSTGGRLNAYKVLLNGDAAHPSRVTNLAIADTGSTALGLSWTAPGDDGAVGTATRYDLRRSPSAIDSANFAAATPVAIAAPLAAGIAEYAQATGLAFSTRYHFALRAIDDFGNAGPVSNDATVSTLGIPALALAPESLTVYVASGGVRDTTLYVSNAGQGRLDFGVTTPAPAGWLTAAPDWGRVAAGATVPVGLHVDATGLADGLYEAALPITDNDPVRPAASVPVRLVVNALTAVADGGRTPFAFRAVSRNPGSSRVALQLSLPSGGPVEVSVYGVDGRRVAQVVRGTLPAGVHRLHWNGTNERGVRVGSGIYFARARAGERASTLRIVIVE